MSWNRNFRKNTRILVWWVLLLCALMAAILFVIYFYRLYHKNISTIRQNLEELRELEEK